MSETSNQQRELTAAQQLQAYRVLTTQNRTFRWDAIDLDDLLRSLVRAGHLATHIELWSDWEARDKQAELNEAHKRITEGEAA